MIAEAISYAKRGWYVVPDHGIKDDLSCTCQDPLCKVQGKHPIIERDSPMAAIRRTGSRLPPVIETWWTDWPWANVAIVCGNKSNLIAIDIDPRNGGLDSLARLESNRGPLTNTVVSMSGGGGMHLLFGHPGNAEVRNRIGLWRGIDVKGDGGRIVAPPSRHKSGNRYTWKPGHGPGEIEVRPIPGWLLNLIQLAKGTGTRSYLTKHNPSN